MNERRLKFWGWGYEGDGPNEDAQRRLCERTAQRFGRALALAPRLEEIALRPPRVKPPAALAQICASDAYDRAAHHYGKSFRDMVRGFRRHYPNPPDVVAYPRTEQEVIAILEWCDSARLAAIPYGGGSSVVGGVEAPAADQCDGAVSIDLRHLDRVLEVDSISRAARIQAGVYGPSLEDQLRSTNFTLRHFPQSFEFSSLGGWIATRSGGHFATLYTHIDDFVESMRVITPTGTIETRRLPGSGAGPSPDRMFIGSEGTLGIITEAWMRLQDRPRFRANASVSFDDFVSAMRALRQLGQAGLYPANCRVLDPGEALTSGAGDGKEAIMVLAFESADHDPAAWMRRALECCADHQGRLPADAGQTRTGSSGAREGAAGEWRRSFLNAPYLREVLVRMGIIAETFETAITWERFESFHDQVMAAVRDAVLRVCGHPGSLTCRITHVYPDGPAPYYTITVPGRNGGELEQWDEIKQAASDTLIRLGGTITHHHAVGRDHRPWYEQETPQGFIRALQAAKHALDPNAILNPGVLFEPVENER
jgi:alkyldihydroxyacetonephosphate synthase